MGEDSRGVTRRVVLVGAASAAGAGAAAALSSNGSPGNLYGGTMALQESYKTAEGDRVWYQGPDSLKSNITPEDGDRYSAVDKGLEFYGNGGQWDKLDVGSPTEPVDAVHADELFTTTNVDHRREWQNRGRSWDNLEDLSVWTADEGSLTANTQDVYTGTQSAELEVQASSTDNDLRISQSFSNGQDFTGVDFSLAVKFLELSHNDDVVLNIQLNPGSWSNRVEFSESIVPDGDGWQRIDFSVTTENGDTNLSNIQKMVIWGFVGADDSARMLIDDLRLVPKRDQGYVMLQFDDGDPTAYSEGFDYMSTYGIPGVVDVVTDSVDGTGVISTDQLTEMQDAGWDVISHSSDTTELQTLSRAEQEARIRSAKKWLQDNGFAKGAEFLVYPGGKFDADTLELADKYHSLAFKGNQGWNKNGGWLTDPHTISRFRGNNNLSDLKGQLDLAAKYNEIAILTFHEIGTGGSFSTPVSDFQAIVDYIAERDDLQVITAADLWEMQQGAPGEPLPLTDGGEGTFSGDGTTTTFTVSHDIPATPDDLTVTPHLDTAAVPIDGVQNITQTSFDVVFSSAPASGTDNVTISWSAQR